MLGRISELVVTPHQKGNIIGNTKKTINLNASCSAQTRITISRKSGNARATVKIFQNNGNNIYNELTAERVTFEAGDTVKTFTLPSPATYRVEIKNLSATKSFGYEAKGTALH